MCRQAGPIRRELVGPGVRPQRGGMSHLTISIGRLRIIGWFEGTSFLILLWIAMPLKYWAGEPGAVRVVGMAHGVLFLLYLLAALKRNWRWTRVAAITVASVLPAGPFILDARVLQEAEQEAVKA